MPRYLSLSWIPSRFEPSICEVTLCTSATFPRKCSTWESNQHDRVEVATENTHHRQGVTSGAQPLPPTPRERMLWDGHALEVTMEGKCVLPIYSTPVAVDAEVEHRPCTFFIFNYFSTMGKKGKGGKFKAVIILAEQRHLSKLWDFLMNFKLISQTKGTLPTEDAPEFLMNKHYKILLWWEISNKIMFCYSNPHKQAQPRDSDSIH